MICMEFRIGQLDSTISKDKCLFCIQQHLPLLIAFLRRTQFFELSADLFSLHSAFGLSLFALICCFTFYVGRTRVFLLLANIFLILVVHPQWPLCVCFWYALFHLKSGASLFFLLCDVVCVLRKRLEFNLWIYTHTYLHKHSHDYHSHKVC